MSYANYKYYDRGGRLSVFAAPIHEVDEDGTTYKTFLFITRCSKKDVFSKQTSREIFDNWKETGESFYTTTRREVTDEDRKNRYPGEKPMFTTVTERHNAHPTIELLRFECTPSNIEKYLSTLYVKDENRWSRFNSFLKGRIHE
jgi:hypothetical protein